MKTSSKWILLGVASFVCLALSIILPVYFFKIKKDSSGVKAGAVLYATFQVELLPAVYQWMFRKNDTMIPFSTDSTGKAFDVGAAGKDLTSIGGITSDGFATLGAIFGGPVCMFDGFVSVTNAQFLSTNSITRVTSTQKTKGCFYMSDDNTKIMVGYIDISGNMIAKPNIPSTFDLSKIPTTWLVKAPSTVTSIVNIINQQFYNMYSAASAHGLSSLKGTAADTETITHVQRYGLCSNTYFVVKVPWPFLMGLFHKPDATGKIIYKNECYKQSFDALSVFGTGWSLCSKTDADAVLQTTTKVGYDTQPNEFTIVMSIPNANPAEAVCRTMRKHSTLPTGLLLHDAGVGEVAYFFVKSETPRTGFPDVSEIMDVRKLYGGFGNLTLAESNVIPATPTTTTTVAPPPSATPPETTHVVEATVQPKKGFVEENGLYIYAGIGVIGSIIVFMFLYWRYFRHPAAAAHPAPPQAAHPAPMTAPAAAPMTAPPPAAAPPAAPLTAPLPQPAAPRTAYAPSAPTQPRTASAAPAQPAAPRTASAPSAPTQPRTASAAPAQPAQPAQPAAPRTASAAPAPTQPRTASAAPSAPAQPRTASAAPAKPAAQPPAQPSAPRTASAAPSAPAQPRTASAAPSAARTSTTAQPASAAKPAV